jgi:5-methyltetrahydrofolate--homocysteine methyltransferase
LLDSLDESAEGDRMNLSEFLSKNGRTILLDGAMGTSLATAGVVDIGGQSNISHPDKVLAIHRAFSEVGCDILITNTLTMNRISIETHHVGVDVKEVNLVGVRLAKSAATPEQYVLGDISSTGQMLKPYGKYTEIEFYDTFREQAEYLRDGGVDGFIVETMIDLREALCAVHACRDVAKLPALASLSFRTTKKGGRTIMGNSAREAAVALAEAGVVAVGANCGDLSPDDTAIIVAIMKETVDLPILAQPNAGRPKFVNGQTRFDMTPEEFAKGIGACLDAGAKLVGGCCGTSPDHIRCVAELLGKKKSDLSKASNHH